MKNAALLVSLVALLLSPLQGHALETAAYLKPTDEQARATELIIQLMDEHHYKNTPLDDALSSQILDNYLKTLDPNRSYFTQENIQSFEKFRFRFDDDLRNGRLDGAFLMFNIFRDRVQERLDYAISLIDQPFDFKIKETYLLDRSEADWAKHRYELDRIWRKRVKNDVLNLRLAESEVEEITDALTTRYTGLAKRTGQLDAEDVYQFFINAYTAAVEPHTSYLSPRASENFMISMSLSLEGIGAVLQNKNEYTLVRKLVPGGPAENSKQLESEDRIVGVGQGFDKPIQNVVGWRLDDVVGLIRGPRGTIVRLEVLPKTNNLGGPTKIVTITRNKIELEEQAASSNVIDVQLGPATKHIGIIKVPTFYIDFAARAAGQRNYRSTTRDVGDLIDDLTQKEHVEGIVIDLRANGGGSLSEATALTGLFIESGPIVQVKDARGRIEFNNDPDPSIAYSGPLAVLVDRHSASASEIFAAAIQDYRRGIIIGEPTFGKGTVQNLIDLGQHAHLPNARLGQLKVTIAQFFRVNGASTQHRGVIPDISYPLLLDPSKEGESAFENALPWDQVSPARFKAAGAPVERYDRVRQRHEQRIKTDTVFQILLEEAEVIREAQAKTSVTLLETQRQLERQQSEDDQRSRETRFRAAVGLPPLPPKDAADDEADSEEEEEDDDPKKDALLSESARILGDLIIQSARPPQRHHADRGTGVAASEIP